MPKPGEAQTTFVQIGIVKSVVPEDRVIDVNYLGSDRGKQGVIIVTDPGSYSCPRVGDAVLILETDPYAYCIGKIEYNYAQKIAGEYPIKMTDKDKEAEKVTLPKAKKVEGGETWIGSVIKKAWFYIANSGNFSVMNGLNDGLKYFAQSRFLRLAGGVVNLVGSGAYIAFGSVMRDIPLQGKTPIPGDIPTIPSVEGLINLLYNNIKLARFHIGHVMDTVLGVAEISSFASRLRCLIEVANPAGIPIAVLKMDEAGNIELSAVTPGKVMLNGNPVNGILLSGLGSAFSSVLGEKLIQVLLNHIHGAPAGNTGSMLPVAGVDVALTDILSKMVKLN